MNDPIRLWSENYVNGDCGITVETGTTEAYLYDQNQDSKYVSAGSSDAITEIITVIFKNWQGTEVSRTFDRIALLNTNFKGMTADYWDGAAWQSIAEATLTLAAANKVIEIATPISATRFRISCTTTQVANAEKYLGELKICANVLDLGLALTTWEPSGEQKAGAYRLAGGALCAWREWTKVAGMLTIENLTKTVKDLLLPYLKASGFITLVFHDTFDVTDLYEMSIVSAPAVAIDRKAELYQLSMEMRER